MTTLQILSRIKFSLDDEKKLQEDIASALKAHKVEFEREYVLDPHNMPDFFIDGTAIEVKIKGNARKIYKQCERYCQFEQVKELILITNRSMGFPKSINGKPCYILTLGKAWL